VLQPVVHESCKTSKLQNIKAVKTSTLQDIKVVKTSTLQDIKERTD
jgi:hypothetical protein